MPYNFADIESKWQNRHFRLMGELNKTVDTIDPTIYGFEEKLGEIEA